jgi:hypothetical protein
VGRFVGLQRSIFRDRHGRIAETSSEALAGGKTLSRPKS